MKILIDIGHPAHVHYFRNFSKIMQQRGSEVLFTCRNKEVTVQLLQHYELQYINFGKNFTNIIGKCWGMLYFTVKIFLISLKFKPDVFINASMYSAIVSKILRKYHISIEDTFNMEQIRLYRPFTDCILTGSYPHRNLGEKEINYDCYQELFYLHPNRFIPNDEVLNILEVNRDDKYVIIRFVSWNASHDVGHKGISLENKIKAVEKFEKFAKVFITSELELPDRLKKYKIKIPPHMMHDALAFATLFYGESGTMASESAVLGTPAIFLDNTGRKYTDDQEKKYSLVFNYTESEEDQLKSISKGIDVLKDNNSEDLYVQRREKLLEDKIDPTDFLVWFVENIPDSFSTMKTHPEFQNRFRVKHKVI